MNTLPPRDIGLVSVVCVVWAINFLTSAFALQEFPPLLFTGLRMALLAAVLWPFLKPPAPGQWPRLLAISLGLGVLHFGLSFWALKVAGDLSSVAIVMQSYVPMSALLAWALLGERIDGKTAVAIAVSFTGVLVLGFDPLVLDRPASLLLMLCSAAFLALATVGLRGLAGQTPWSQQGWLALISVGPLLGLSLWLEGPPAQTLAAGTWVGWSGVAYSALVSSLLGHRRGDGAGRRAGAGASPTLHVALTESRHDCGPLWPCARHGDVGVVHRCPGPTRTLHRLATRPGIVDPSTCLRSH